MKEQEEDAQLKRRECWIKNSQSQKAAADDDEGAQQQYLYSEERW